MAKRLGCTVGLNGKNHRMDVKYIQVLLNRHQINTRGPVNHNALLKVDGICGSKTIAAIRDYQVRVMHMAKIDARVDPGAPTFRKLSLNWYSKNDEAYKIIEYIIQEIKTNCQSKTVKRLRELNGFSIGKCITEWKKEPLLIRALSAYGGAPNCADKQVNSKAIAFTLWAEKVRTNGEWDHKPYIAKTFKFRVPRSSKTQERHILGDFTYYYDLWSNIHYGYVGAAAGFSESELLDGAGLEQIGTTLLRLGLPKKNADGLRGWDDEPDRVSIGIGIELYKKNSNNINAEDVLEKIRQAGAKLKPNPYPTI
jgi:hypothetical protein